MRESSWYVVLCAVLIAASTDVWKFRIFNALTAPLFLSGLLFHTVAAGPAGLAESVLGVFVGTMPFVPLYARGGMGAGDLKLMAGVGAWIGPWAILHVLIISGLATCCCMAVLVARRQPAAAPVCGDHAAVLAAACPGSAPRPASCVGSVLNRPDRRRKAVPFGVMVALGVIVLPLWIR